MLKQCLLMATFICAQTAVHGQATYSRMFDFFGFWETATSLLRYDTLSKRMILSGTFINLNPTSDTTKYRHAFTWTLDSLGNASVKTVLGKPPGNLIGFHPFQFGNKTLALSEVQYTAVSVNTLFYLDQNGDTLSGREVDYPAKFNSWTHCLLDGKIYSTGKDQTVDNTNHAPFSILCFDSAGRKIWFKSLTGKKNTAYWSLPTSDGNMLVSGLEWRGPLGDDTTYAWYAKMDTSGRFIWERTHATGGELYRSIPVEVNGTYFWLGDKSEYLEKPYAYLYKTGSSGDVIWNKRILEGSQVTLNPGKPLFTSFGLPITKNDFIYATGYLRETYSNGSSYHDYIQFAKIDTLGNIHWRRLFKQWREDNRPFSLHTLPDGFLICGDGKDTTHTTGYSDAWVIKTDTNGCVVPGCHLTDGMVQIINPEAVINVFPNPATDGELTVTTTDDQAFAKSIIVYDMQGVRQMTPQTRHKTTTISTKHLQSGYYFIVVELNDGSRACKKVLVGK